MYNYKYVYIYISNKPYNMLEVGHLGGAAVFRRPPDRFLADSAVRRPVVLADSAGRRMGTWLIPPAADSDRWFGASLADSAGRRAGWLAGWLIPPVVGVGWLIPPAAALAGWVAGWLAD